MACAINCAASPACSSSVRWPRGDPILPLIATDSAYRIGLKSLAAVTSSWMTRSQISRDNRRHCRRTCPEPRRPRFDRPYRRCPVSPYGRDDPESWLGSQLHRYAASARFRRRREGPSGISFAERSRRQSRVHIIAIGRLRGDQRTKDYVARRLAEGHSKLDAIRALERYLAREVFTLITQRRKEINATRIAA